MKKFLNDTFDFVMRTYIPLCLFLIYFIISQLASFPPCLVKVTIGFPCPGCGITRALVSLFRGDLTSAFNNNPSVFILVFIALVLLFKNYSSIVMKLYKNKIMWVSMLAYVIFVYIVRLIYVYPNEPVDYYPHSILKTIIDAIVGLFK